MRLQRLPATTKRCTYYILHSTSFFGLFPLFFPLFFSFVAYFGLPRWISIPFIASVCASYYIFYVSVLSCPVCAVSQIHFPLKKILRQLPNPGSLPHVTVYRPLAGARFSASAAATVPSRNRRVSSVMALPTASSVSPSISKYSFASAPGAGSLPAG